MKPLQCVCGFECAKAWGNKQTTKAINQDTRRRKLASKPKAELLKEAQRFFNLYIRERDKHLGCISCGTTTSNQYAAGHYRSVGAMGALRFEELNVHKQCNRYCNMELSGNIINYRINLVKKIGLEKVEWLEGPHQPKHYTIEEIKQIKILYKEKTKALTQINEEPARIGWDE